MRRGRAAGDVAPDPLRSRAARFGRDGRVGRGGPGRARGLVFTDGARPRAGARAAGGREGFGRGLGERGPGRAGGGRQGFGSCGRRATRGGRARRRRRGWRRRGAGGGGARRRRRRRDPGARRRPDGGVLGGGRLRSNARRSGRGARERLVRPRAERVSGRARGAPAAGALRFINRQVRGDRVQDAVEARAAPRAAPYVVEESGGFDAAARVGAVAVPRGPVHAGRARRERGARRGTGPRRRRGAPRVRCA